MVTKIIIITSVTVSSSTSVADTAQKQDDDHCPLGIVKRTDNQDFFCAIEDLGGEKAHFSSLISTLKALHLPFMIE
jgi:hypothetical protein